MSLNPQYRVVGKGWAIGVYFRDTTGNPIDLAAVGAPVPSAEYYQGLVNQTIVCTVVNGRVQIVDAQSGYVVFFLEAAITQAALATISTPQYIPPQPSMPAVAYPVRLNAFLTDSQGVASGQIIIPIVPLDPRTADLTTIPPPSSMVVAVGPAGAKGDPGLNGAGITVNNIAPAGTNITLGAADVGALAKASNLSDLPDKAAARTALGINAAIAAYILSLPTTLPGAPGQLWLNGNTVSVS